MTPIAHFNDVWSRCAHLTDIQAYVANNVAAAFHADELLRVEWVSRFSALDLYIHELVFQGMVEIFEGRRTPTPAYLRFQISNETVSRINSSTNAAAKLAAFDLEIRSQLSTVTYQHPEKIAEGVRLVSEVELWNEVALVLGANQSNKIAQAKLIKKGLSLAFERRNKIAHEGDLQPTIPRQPWPISQGDLRVVATDIESIVRAIDSVV
ncbi:hypothetical protein JJB99_01810 [Bradyrhizobium diazoefficiens]|uniref:hypothetical protein n=1 Tax=Bradyrhizobium diazoefficiens TaxID=1355477 RepID=UPI00190CA1C7|nr:hypothetical protein [Bradyrhizobium diazoefficiens]QQO14954.1 hypothetical protein JJB99_01810 [Bradyrhizobium diazoefficiens]